MGETVEVRLTSDDLEICRTDIEVRQLLSGRGLDVRQPFGVKHDGAGGWIYPDDRG